MQLITVCGLLYVSLTQIKFTLSYLATLHVKSLSAEKLTVQEPSEAHSSLTPMRSSPPAEQSPT